MIFKLAYIFFELCDMKHWRKKKSELKQDTKTASRKLGRRVAKKFWSSRESKYTV